MPSLELSLMTRSRLVTAVVLSMLAFAGNSLLCRLALKQTHIDPATFTSIRLMSGSAMLWILLRGRGNQANNTNPSTGDWLSALALFAYAVCFSYAYVALSAGTGALLAFGAVQTTMVSYGFAKGERPHAREIIGFVAAVVGLLVLLLPSATTPSLANSLTMLAAGTAWGVYSIRGKSVGDPARATAGNFYRCIPLTVALSVCTLPWISIDPHGVVYAVISGALTSGIGYIIWYAAVKELRVTQAATAQLGVPLVTALGGIIFLGESLSLHVLVAAVLVLGGMAIVVLGRGRRGVVR